MDVEIRHLRAFVAVATAGSFSRGAGQLFITQPALTRTIRQLESLLGATLIDRGTHPVSLTPAGEEFYPYASRILNHLDIAVAAVRQHATVRLGFSWLLPDPWAQDTVASFEEATGDSVSLIRSDDPLTAISEGRVDVAVIRGTVAETSALRVVHLFDEGRVAACSVGFDLAAGELDWRDAADWTLVVNTISGTTGPWSWPDGGGPRRFVPTANFDEWVESVAAGRGIGVLPDVAQRRGIHPAIRFIPLRNAPLIPVSLAFRPGVREPLLRRFVQAALAAVSSPG
ncbi:MAG TPA: LysR family transcriptional regulator [Trebonia sp.]|nr:LysR family transcriptional regulator [Trebonia sp.]